ncbi:hypothetical protein LINPERHAP2_LOCUS22295 [Linum perenne]
MDAGFSVGGIMKRWRRENKLNKASVILRGAGFVPSMFVYDWMSFNRYEEYRFSRTRYLVGIMILTTLYAGGEAFQQLHDLTPGDTRFEFLNEPLPSFTFTATVLFEKMVLQKDSVDGPQVLQMQIAECMVGDETRTSYSLQGMIMGSVHAFTCAWSRYY